MVARKEMSIDERRKYLGRMLKRYQAANRTEKGKLLDEMELVTQMHRKSIVRLLHAGGLERKKRKKERGKVYGADVQHNLSVIAESFGYICAQRLHGNLDWMVDMLVEHGELHPTPEVKEKLQRASISTLQRLLQGIDRDVYYMARSKPKQQNTLMAAIPARRLPWNESEPGHMEIDLVQHCGKANEGEFAYSLQMVDVATGWSEIAAILGRSQLVVEDACQRILDRIPFAILQLHPDNGGEFLNHHLMRFWKDAVPQLYWSRSRTYKNNDNRFVEQKNSSLIRAWFGFERIDTVKQVNAMNDFYEKLRLYYNLLQPVMRLKEKRVYEDKRGDYRVRRIYGQALTPFERLCATKAIAPEEIPAWQSRREAINPRHLRLEMHRLRDRIMEMPGAQPGRTEDVYLTLLPKTQKLYLGNIII